MKRVIYLFAAVALTVAMTACTNTASKKSEAQATEVKSEVAHATLAVKGACGMCKTRIEKTAKAVKGVSTAEWSLEKQELVLDFDSAQTSLKSVSEAIAKVGHDTASDTAPDDVYNALPGCCQYRN